MDAGVSVWRLGWRLLAFLLGGLLPDYRHRVDASPADEGGDCTFRQDQGGEGGCALNTTPDKSTDDTPDRAVLILFGFVATALGGFMLAMILMLTGENAR